MLTLSPGIRFQAAHVNCRLWYLQRFSQIISVQSNNGSIPQIVRYRKLVSLYIEPTHPLHKKFLSSFKKNNIT